MKIAIASEKEDINSAVSERGGRAKYYLLFENKQKIETIKNPFAVGGGGAGYSVIEMLSDKKVDVIVCGKFGSNMINAMDQKNIKYKEIQDKTIKEVIDNF